MRVYTVIQGALTHLPKNLFSQQIQQYVGTPVLDIIQSLPDRKR